MFNRQRNRARPLFSVVAAVRPNFMKVGPVISALKRMDADVELIHTGQHYDQAMSESFFQDLDLPRPDRNLGIGSGSHAAQTGAVMVAYESYLLEVQPDAVVVVGDVNSTLAATIAATKVRIPVAHVEAGLRSRDWSMPEEVNRMLTDRVSRWLFAPSPDGYANLVAEGLPENWIHLVGNVMVDTLLANLPRARARASSVLHKLGQEPGGALLTLHRPSNVDAPEHFERLLKAVADVASDGRVTFPVHPRARRTLTEGAALPSNIDLVDPLGYLDFIALMDQSAVVFTDSGGVQEETSVLGVPCVTLRQNTERPITCEIGSNELAGTDPESVRAAGLRARERSHTPSQIEGWDGRAGERIAGVLVREV